jgi:hypothetical protein
LIAANATFALKAGEWFRRGLLLIAAPDSRASACPLSGRNSTYRTVRNCGATSGAGFAQSPQALVLEDRVRVYFSTRERDTVGKYLSHVAFVDFDKGMQRILGVSTAPVIPLGDLGCFDEHGIFPIHIMKDTNGIVAYTTGWNRKASVSADASIGFAESYDNGLTFQKYGTGPIMTASLHEPFLVGDAFVSKFEGGYHMWYIFGLRWMRSCETEQPERVYKIAHASSHDGIEWRRDSQPIIVDRIGSDECQALLSEQPGPPLNKAKIKKLASICVLM